MSGSLLRGEGPKPRSSFMGGFLEEAVFKLGSKGCVFLNLSTINILSWVIVC